MNRAPATSYDETPYPSLSYAQTHPDRLATVATLLGLQPARVERCRVLELGCATGGNLLPMAYGLPNSKFIGIDNSRRQIEVCRHTAEAMGVTNVESLDADVTALPADLGRFDYIVAHGMYSWMPEPARDKLLQACREHLAPQGVAYVSYNTYPGWHLLQMVRELMLYRTRGIDDPTERVTEARRFVSILAEACSGDESAHGAFLRAYEANVMPKLADEPGSADALLLHDELEAVNAPVYFHQFAEHAARHGMQYLCEARLADVMPVQLSPDTAERFAGLTRDPIELEQYMDFLKNRSFRGTLLCHEGLAVTRQIRPEPIRRMLLSSRARPVSGEPRIEASESEEFRGLDGATFKTDHPLTKAALVELHRVSPKPVQFMKLATAVGAAIGMTSAAEMDEHSSVLAGNMLRAYGYSDSIVGLHAYEPRFTLEPGTHPVASAVARVQAAERARVTNMLHERVTLVDEDVVEWEPTARHVLPRLDGNHDRAALVDVLSDAPGVEAAPEPEAALDGMLRFFARAALLVE